MARASLGNVSNLELLAIEWMMTMQVLFDWKRVSGANDYGKDKSAIIQIV